MNYHREISFIVVLYVRMLTLPAAQSAPVPATQSERTTPTTTEPPKLLVDIYECWNNGGEHCLDLPALNPQIDTVRSLIGKYEKPSEAVHSGSSDVPLNSIAFTFNTSMFDKDILYSAFVRIHTNFNEAASTQCDTSKLILQLYATLPLPGEDKERTLLFQTMTLSTVDLAQDGWFNFSNVTTVVEKSKLRNSQMKLRLAVGGECAGIPLSKLGLSFDKDPELIGYCKSGAEFPRLPQLKNLMQKQKRSIVQATQGESTEGPTISPIERLRSSRCKMHDFNVSLAELWDFVVLPKSFNAKLCAGRCNWPLDASHNVTRHSYIQSIFNFKNPNEIPAPCCAPKPGTLTELRVLLRESEVSYVSRRWPEMIATMCACL